MKTVPFGTIPLHVPLVNVMSTVDDLSIASIKVNEAQQMIREQEENHGQNLYAIATSWRSILGTMIKIVNHYNCMPNVLKHLNRNVLIRKYES
jgi:hypothetical protein